MEDSKRDMEPGERKQEKVKTGSGNQERLTIMIFRKVGKVSTFKVSSGYLWVFFLFFLLYIAGSLFMINSYFDLKRKSKKQAKEIVALRNELLKTAKSLEKSKHHIALLEEYIEENDQEPTQEAMVNHTESSFPKLVEVDDLKVKRDESKININFRIVNSLSNEEPVGGYIFIMIKERGAAQSEAWVYPRTSLKDGLPVNYKNGHRFLIKRFKIINCSYRPEKSTDKTLVLRIVVFDRDGELILKKVVEV